MYANAWAALGMSVTDASRPADWTKKKKKPPPECVLIEPEPHVSVRHAFISSVSSPGFTSKRKVCTFCTSDFTAWDSYPALCQRGGEKKKVAVAVLWNFWGGGSGSWNPGGPAALIIAWVCLGGTCLPVPRKIISASRNKQREKRCTLAWANPSVLCFVFLLCILLFLSSQFSVSLSLSKFRARAWVDLRGLKKQGSRPHRTAYVCVFVCVPGICRSLTLRRMRRQRCNTLPGDRRGTSWYACRLLIYLIDVLSLSSARQYTERIIDHLYNSFCV